LKGANVHLTAELQIIYTVDLALAKFKRVNSILSLKAGRTVYTDCYIHTALAEKLVRSASKRDAASQASVQAQALERSIDDLRRQLYKVRELLDDRSVRQEIQRDQLNELAHDALHNEQVKKRRKSITVRHSSTKDSTRFVAKVIADTASIIQRDSSAVRVQPTPASASKIQRSYRTNLLRGSI
jgi:hypothetical protein